jgi:hypothetical protein
MTDVSGFGEVGGGVLHDVPISDELAMPSLAADRNTLAKHRSAPDDLSVLDDGDPLEQGAERRARQRDLSRIARFAALDPDDGIPL